jgi:hypothetical protein
MKKLIVVSFVAALAVAGCSKKKADTMPAATTGSATEMKADPCAGKTADPCAGKTADPCAGKAADPCAGKTK